MGGEFVLHYKKPRRFVLRLDHDQRHRRHLRVVASVCLTVWAYVSVPTAVSCAISQPVTNSIVSSSRSQSRESHNSIISTDGISNPLALHSNFPSQSPNTHELTLRVDSQTILDDVVACAMYSVEDYRLRFALPSKPSSRGIFGVAVRRRK